MHDQDDDTFEELFSQFDPLVQDGPRPVANTGLALTASRRPGPGERLVRWIVQGNGLLTLFLLAFLATLIDVREVGLSALGVLLVSALIAPLLGRRPLAQPVRWTVMALLAAAGVTLVAATARFFVLLHDSRSAPVSAMVSALCSVLSRATSPSGGAPRTAVLIVLSLVLARWLATAHPWLETRPERRAWRRPASLALLGLIGGTLFTLPLFHHMLWNQPWVVKARAELGPSATRDVAYGRPDDIVGRLSLPEGSNLEGLALTPTQAKTIVTYLAQGRTLTVRDHHALRTIINHSLREARPYSNDLLWQIYLRAYDREFAPYWETAASALLRHRIFPALAQESTSEALLKTWHDRLERLEVIKPVSKEAVDDLFFERLQDYSPALYQDALQRADYERPLRLFGFSTGWTPAALATDAERSLALLIYSHRRRLFDQPGFLREPALAPPYTPLSLFGEDSLYRLFGSVSNKVGNHDLQVDGRLLRDLWKLKQQKLETGRFPSNPDLHASLSYRASGATARLETAWPSRGRLADPALEVEVR